MSKWETLGKGERPQLRELPQGEAVKGWGCVGGEGASGRSMVCKDPIPHPSYSGTRPGGEMGLLDCSIDRVCGRGSGQESAPRSGFGKTGAAGLAEVGVGVGERGIKEFS